MTNLSTLEATEPGWFTTDPWGKTEFWPLAEWDMVMLDPTSEDDKYLVSNREDATGPTHEFGRGYTIFTATVVNHQIMVMPGWQCLSDCQTWWYARETKTPEGPMTHANGTPCENGVSCYPESRCAGCW